MEDVHKRAMRRFEEAVLPQLEVREHALMCRRFISIPGAMWEGEWGDQFENAIKVEIDKISRGVEKIITDYRENRIVPDFRPADDNANQDTADTLDGLHRADNYRFKAQQARDNAFDEAVSGGFGAYRLRNELDDPYDRNNDKQRVNPGLIIVDADQRVFFDPNSKLYDKSDARYAFVVTAMTKGAFEEEHPDKAVDWPDQVRRVNYSFFTPEVVRVCEYYEVEDKRQALYILTHALSGEERRLWSDEIDAAGLEEMEVQGWTWNEQRRQRRRVHKWLLSGAEVLDDEGLIAGDQIPVVPVYGKRWFVDNQERFRGYVSKRIDSQRIYNAKVSKLAETDTLAPREIPIFAAEQMPPELALAWSRLNIDRAPYALVNPLLDAEGNVISAGPIGKIEPPNLSPVTALLLQAAAADLSEETADGAEEVKANTSAEAMDIAATRVDAKSGIYLDNMRQSVQREGEVYLSMAADVYVEEGREVETMSEDGDDGVATLMQPFTDAAGRFGIRNDFAKGRYKVIADVTEATATRRDKTVKSSLNIAEKAVAAQDVELAQAALLTAILNQDGEGMEDMHRFARKRGLSIGLVEPNEEEKAAMQQASENQQPQPTEILAQAQAQALEAQAEKDLKLAGKAEADTQLSEARVVETLADARKKGAEALRPANDDRARIRLGRDLAS